MNKLRLFVSLSTVLGISLLSLTLKFSQGAKALLIPPTDNFSLGEIILSDLPEADRSGSVEIEGGPPIAWNAGELPVDYLPIGIIDEGLGVGEITLDYLGSQARYDPNSFSLYQ